MPTITTNAQSSSTRWHALRLTRQAMTWESKDGDSYRSKSTARLPSGLSRTEVRAICRSLARELSTHCQHSYDCCGRWYRSATVSATGRHLTVVFHNYQNI